MVTLIKLVFSGNFWLGGLIIGGGLLVYLYAIGNKISFKKVKK